MRMCICIVRSNMNFNLTLNQQTTTKSPCSSNSKNKRHQLEIECPTCVDLCVCDRLKYRANMARQTNSHKSSSLEQNVSIATNQPPFGPVSIYQLDGTFQATILGWKCCFVLISLDGSIVYLLRFCAVIFRLNDNQNMVPLRRTSATMKNRISYSSRKRRERGKKV